MSKKELNTKEIAFYRTIVDHLNAIVSSFDNKIKINLYHNSNGDIELLEYVANSNLQYEILLKAVLSKCKDFKTWDNLEYTIQFDNGNNWTGTTLSIPQTFFSIELFYEEK